MEFFVFVIASAIVLVGALGVVWFRNPVHNALALVATLFGVAVHFVAQEANFLAAVQVIVYAGAIVVLFLFVIMLLGVDKAENLQIEPLKAQRPVAVVAGAALLAMSVAALVTVGSITGDPGQRTAASLPEGAPPEPDITTLGKLIFSDYVFAFEATAILLTVAVVAAVVLSRKVPAEVPAEAGEHRNEPVSAAQ